MPGLFRGFCHSHKTLRHWRTRCRSAAGLCDAAAGHYGCWHKRSSRSRRLRAEHEQAGPYKTPRVRPGSLPTIDNEMRGQKRPVRPARGDAQRASGMQASARSRDGLGARERLPAIRRAHASGTAAPMRRRRVARGNTSRRADRWLCRCRSEEGPATRRLCRGGVS